MKEIVIIIATQQNNSMAVVQVSAMGDVVMSFNVE
jgi:hypothetical protein